MKFYTLRTLIKEYGIEFRGNCKVYSNVKKMSGMIYGAGGYGIPTQEEIEKELDKPYQVMNMDIGYIDLHNAQGTFEACQRAGFEVELI